MSHSNVDISCSVRSDVRPDPVFFAKAQDVLQRLDAVRHTGDSMHPTKFELEAQKALLRHAIQYGVTFQLNDDHWGRTGYLLLTLFEVGKASMEIDGKRFHFAELIKEDWWVSDEQLGGHGGFLYRDSDGNVIYKRGTRIG